MPYVVGADLSTRAIDLVKLAENDNRAEWIRCELHGETAWERALRVHQAIALTPSLHGLRTGTGPFWDDVYLVAIETPVNDQRRVLRLIQGAVIASLPGKLRKPHCCWDVHPSTWKAGLGLKGKPASDYVARLAGEGTVIDLPQASWVDAQQNFRDAYCLAMYARDTNARAVAAALGETA